MGLDELSAYAEIIRDVSEALMLEGGTVPPPGLMAFRGDQPVGRVTMRPAARGRDGLKAVAQMSMLAAAARADNVIASWEQLDLEVLCGGRPGSLLCAVQVLWASATGDLAAISYPFEIEVLCDDPPFSVRPIWGEARRPAGSDSVPAVIAALLAKSWEPFDHPGADERAMAVYLRSLGHEVDLVA